MQKFGLKATRCFGISKTTRWFGKATRCQKLCSYWLTKQRVALGKQRVAAMRNDPNGLLYTGPCLLFTFSVQVYGAILKLTNILHTAGQVILINYAHMLRSAKLESVCSQ